MKKLITLSFVLFVAISAFASDFSAPAEATEKPVLLKSTLDVRCEVDQRYWKMPESPSHSNWIPQVNFQVFYKSEVRMRLMAEYFTPDGKPWFSETLDNGIKKGWNTQQVSSSRDSSKFEKTATVAVGTYGVKITNTRDNSVLFQGKFKVNKYKYGPNIPMFKNQYSYYVEQDWNLPIGYVWLNWEGNGGPNTPMIKVGAWIKDEIRRNDLEGRIYYKGQEIGTTDGQGMIENNLSRFPNNDENKSLAHWKRWDFSWYNVRYAMNERDRPSYPQSKFINDMDGEYVVKIYYKAQQIREMKFNVSGGKLADNGIAAQSNLGDQKVIVPVKVLNSTEKWNALAWKTDAFYGNPLAGFSLQ